jgi:hypothetical protein
MIPPRRIWPGKRVGERGRPGCEFKERPGPFRSWRRDAARTRRRAQLRDQLRRILLKVWPGIGHTTTWA